jgi:hypothetical protein
LLLHFDRNLVPIVVGCAQETDPTMTTMPVTTGARYSAYDEVTCDDRATLERHLWGVLAKLAGVPYGPVDSPPPFPPIPGVDIGYRVPHPVSDQLIAMLSAEVLNGCDRRGPSAVFIDAKKVTRSPKNCWQAISRLAGAKPGKTDVRRGVIAIENPAADLPNVACPTSQNACRLNS